MLRRADVRRKGVARVPIRHKPDGELRAQILSRQGRGYGDGVFVRAFLQLAGLDVFVEVDHYPHVARQAKVELFGHEPARPRGAVPVDSVQAVAEGVFADARGVGGEVVGAAARGAFAGEKPRRNIEQRQLVDSRVDHEVVLLAKIAVASEKPERVGAGHADGSELIDAALSRRRERAPRPKAARGQADGAPAAVAGHVGGVLDLQGGFGEGAAVADCDTLFDVVSDARALGAALGAHFQPARGEPRPRERQRRRERQNVDQPKEQPEPGRRARNRGHDD